MNSMAELKEKNGMNVRLSQLAFQDTSHINMIRMNSLGETPEF